MNFFGWRLVKRVTSVTSVLTPGSLILAMELACKGGTGKFVCGIHYIYIKKKSYCSLKYTEVL